MRKRDHTVAAILAFEAYGTEILSFLIGRLRDHSAGEEVFGMFAEDLWRALPGFERRCSMRTFMFALARNAARGFASAPDRQARRRLPLPADEAISAVIVRARSATEPFRRTEAKSRLRAMLETLPEQDQELVVLRIDRKMSWRDIACVLGNLPADDQKVEREAARLRKRYQVVKDTLRARAEQEGLLNED